MKEQHPALGEHGDVPRLRQRQEAEGGDNEFAGIPDYKARPSSMNTHYVYKT